MPFRYLKNRTVGRCGSSGPVVTYNCSQDKGGAATALETLERIKTVTHEDR